MQIQPRPKLLAYKALSLFFLSLVAGIIPLIGGVFIYGIMIKMGREGTVDNTYMLITFYLLATAFIYIFQLIKEYYYSTKTKLIAKENGIEITRTFIGSNKTIIPYLKISSIEIHQGILEKFLGLATLFIYTKQMENNHELYGFDYQDLSAFAEKIINEYKIGVK